MFEEDVVRPKIFMINLLTSHSFKSLSFFLILFPPQYRGWMFLSRTARLSMGSKLSSDGKLTYNADKKLQSMRE
jgi:hypothetical protein